MNEERFKTFIQEDLSEWAKKHNHAFLKTMCEMTLLLLETDGYEKAMDAFRMLLFNDNARFILARLDKFGK